MDRRNKKKGERELARLHDLYKAQQAPSLPLTPDSDIHGSHGTDDPDSTQVRPRRPLGQPEIFKRDSSIDAPDPLGHPSPVPERLQLSLPDCNISDYSGPKEVWRGRLRNLSGSGSNPSVDETEDQRMQQGTPSSSMNTLDDGPEGHSLRDYFTPSSVTDTSGGSSEGRSSRQSFSPGTMMDTLDGSSEGHSSRQPFSPGSMMDTSGGGPEGGSSRNDFTLIQHPYSSFQPKVKVYYFITAFRRGVLDKQHWRCEPLQEKSLKGVFDEVASRTSKTDIRIIRFQLSRTSQPRTPKCISYSITRENTTIYGEMVSRFRAAIDSDSNNNKIWDFDIELEVDPEHRDDDDVAAAEPSDEPDFKV